MVENEISHEILSESDRRNMLGQAVIEHGEAKVKVAQLDKKAQWISATFRRLADSFGQHSPADKIRHARASLALLKHEKLDWADLSESGLDALINGLEQAISDRDRLAEERRNLGDRS